MNRCKLFTAVFSVAASAGIAQQLPPGTHSVDDHTQQNAASAQISEAESALEKQDYKGAEAKLKVLAAANPKDGRVQYDLGFAEERNGEEADAAKAYAAAIAAIPEFAEPRVALGLLDARSGQVEAAHKQLTDAAMIPTAPPELRGRALRALAHLDETSNPDAAREELLAALKLTPETPDDVLMGAELADRSGDSEDAIPAYRRALKLMPGDLDATAGLAHALQHAGKLADADTVLTPALKEHPNDVRLVAQAASLYAAEGKAAEAIPLLVQLRASDAKIAADLDMTRLLAQLEYVNGDNVEAEKLYTEMLVSRPNDPMLLDALGSAQVKQGKDAEAEATFVKAVKLRAAFHDDQAWGEAEGHLAFAASKNNDPQTSLGALDARSTVLPNSPTSLFLQATAHDKLHQNKQAVAAYKAFLAIAGDKFPDQTFEAQHRIIALQHVQ
ncbi:tetratricopeptide repeat protein [Granulicella sp. L46]|uniref:tetratricopeptide repeat protein n=1 Tax=Granulicella sp. L46 TaxID=1641865 RepID=UPI00131DA3C9|nr:tetratricopeptide repeat protein [Granulicella sp. L46]